MTRPGPWSVKGVDEDVRQIARDAAAREGLTIGAWVDRAILNNSTDSVSPPANESALPPDRPAFRQATIEDFEAAIEKKILDSGKGAEPTASPAPRNRRDEESRPRDEKSGMGAARYAVAATVLIALGAAGFWAFTEFSPRALKSNDTIASASSGPHGAPAGLAGPAPATASPSGATDATATTRIAALEKSAKDGDVKAQNQLGTIYLQGIGVTPAPAEARQWFEMAARSGNSEALYNLGLIYENGTGVAKDQQKAAIYFSRALAAGSAKAARKTTVPDERTVAAIEPAAGASIAPSTLSPEQIADIQRLLARLHLSPGEPNGTLGDATMEAIKMYQRFAGLPVDGQPSAALHADLKQVVAAMEAGKR